MFLSAGSEYQSTYSHLTNCSISASLFDTSVKCSYPNNSIVTGFEVVAVEINSDSLGQVHVNKSVDTATIQVEEDKTYQIVVFPIRDEAGILGSSVEFSEILIISTSTEYYTEESSGMDVFF